MGSPAPQDYTITGPPLSPEAATAAMTPPQQSGPAQPVQATQPGDYTITGPPLNPEAAAAAMTPPAPAAAASDYTVTGPPLTPAAAAPADVVSPIYAAPDTPPAMAYTMPETGPVVAQPERQTGFLSGLFSGMGASAREGGQLVTGNAFTDQPGGPQPEPERSWLNSLGYGLGHSAPTLAATLAGGAFGAEIGAPAFGVGAVPGAIVGAGVGGGTMALAQDLVPAYQAARAQKMDHNAAVNYAFEHAAATGAFTGATAAIVPPPLRSLVGRILAQTFIVQPAAGAVMRTGIPLVMGEPLPSAQEYLEGAGQDIATGFGFAGAHALANRGRAALTPRPAPPGPEATATAREALAPTGEASPTQQVMTEGQAPGVPGMTPPASVPRTPVSGGEATAAAPVAPVVPPPTEASAPTATGRQPTGEPLSPVPPRGSEPAVEPVPAAPVKEPPAAEPPVPPASAPPVETPTSAPPVRPPEVPPVQGEGQPAATVELPRTEGQPPAPSPPVTPAPGAPRPAAPSTITNENLRGSIYPLDAEDRELLADHLERTLAKRGSLTWDNVPNDMSNKLATNEWSVVKQLLTEDPQRLIDALRGKYGDDGLNTAAGRPAAAPVVGEPTAPRLEPTGVREPAGGGGDQAARGGGTGTEPGRTEPLGAAARPEPVTEPTAEPTAEPADVRGAAPGEPAGRAAAPVEPAAEAGAPAEASRSTMGAREGAPAAPRVERLTTEPDHLDPTRSVAKNAAGEVVGKGATPEEATADAQQRGGTPYEETPQVRAPEDYRKLDPNISHTEYVNRLQELRDNKPRPIEKWFGKNYQQTRSPEEIAAYQERVKAWNNEYRRVSAVAKLALERDNAAFRARQEGQPPGEDGTQTVPRDAYLRDEATGPGTRGQEPGGELAPELTPNNQQAPETTAQKPTEAARNIDGLTEARDQALRRVQRLERNPNTDPKRLAAARERAAAAQAELDRASPETAAGTEGAATAAEQERIAGQKQPFSGPPQTGQPKTFYDYKYNNGISVYRSVLAEAGHDPDSATQKGPAFLNRVLQDHLVNKFGFKSVRVELPKGGTGRVDMNIANNAMLDLTRALHDMMAALAHPVEAGSNMGNFHLVIDPEGKVSYFGAYEHNPSTIRIMGRANSFGHEWAHGIDHWLAERLTGNPSQANHLLSQYGRHTGLNVQDSVQKAFAKLMNTLFYDEGALALRVAQLENDAKKVNAQGQPTGNAKTAQDQLAKIAAGSSQLRIQMSKFRDAAMNIAGLAKGQSYFGTIWELIGRSHEAYVSRKMQQNGMDPRGVVMPDEAYHNETDRLLKMLYPKGDEFNAIFDVWDEVHAAMRNEEVFGKGAQPAGPSNYGISDTQFWPKNVPAGSKGPTQQYRNQTLSMLERLRKASPFDPSRPDPAGYSLGTRFADSGRAVVGSTSGVMQTLIDRAPSLAKPYLQELKDRLATAPGSGRLTHENFEEAFRRRGRTWTRQMGNILNDHGLDPNTMDPEEGEMLRHFLTTGDKTFPLDPLDPAAGTKAIPKNIQEAGGRMRELLNGIWQEAHNAGLDIGYAKSGFFPRLYDQAKIFSNTGGFLQAAGKLHQLIFDQEVGRPGDNPANLLERWEGLSANEKKMAPPGLDNEMAALKKNLARQAEIGTPQTPVEQAELAKLQTDAEALAKANHDILRDHNAEIAAANWLGRIQNPKSSYEFDMMGPSQNYMKARVLPPEADLLMRDFMHTQPTDAIPHYIHAVSRRISFAERFGAKGEEIDRLINAANRAGARGEDTQWMSSLVHNLLGHDQPGWLKKLAQGTNVIHALGSLVLMPRAMWSGLAEPVNAALATGEIKFALKNISNQIGQLARRASAQDRTELAQYLGTVTTAMHDSIQLSRMSADYSDSPALNKLMTQYYRVTGMTQMVNAQRVAATASSSWFLGKLARDFLNTGTSRRDIHARDDAARWFKELGLTDAIHNDFSQFMLSLGGGLPKTADLINHDMGSAYGLAIRRLVDRVNQDPYKADRAILSSTPGVGLVFQLMSFNYQFQKNVLNPLWGRIEHSYGRAKLEAGGGAKGTAAGVAAAGGSLVRSAAMVSAVVGAGMMTSFVRQLLFAPDQVQKHADDGTLFEYLRDLAFQRSGLNGTLDPIIQVASNLRYQADLSSLMDGATMNWFTKNAMDVITPLTTVNDSPNTNTRYYNQARGLFNLFGVPVAATGLTMLGSAGGPLTRFLSGAALQFGTSPGAANYVAATATGDKGTKLPKVDEYGLPQFTDAELGIPDFDAMINGPKEGPDKSGGMAGFGLMDDVALPAWRYGQAWMSKLPGSLKVGAALAALGYGYSTWNDKTAPFRAASDQARARAQ